MAEEIKPGWIAPGGKYKLADPVEHGWVPVEETAEKIVQLKLIPIEVESEAA